jgi:hypothetical protein
MQQTLAPIVLFVYNRPEHTRRTLESLHSNELAAQSTLYVFADGPKSDATGEQLEQIKLTRNVIKEKKWCASVIIHEADRNKGLANSIIEGVSEVVERHGRTIVLEDDLLLSPFFLAYMNECLDAYAGSDNVYSVNGYMFPVEDKRNDAVLLPYSFSWGWGTWADKWKCFEREPAAIKTIQDNTHLRKRFNLGDYDYASMLDNKGSWAIRWYYSIFVRNGLSLFPTLSLVENIGLDGSGTNCDTMDISVFKAKSTVQVKKESTIDMEMWSKLTAYFTNSNTAEEQGRLRRMIRYVTGK